MNKPASHGDGRPLAAHVEDETSVSPNKATKPTSVPNLPLIPSGQGSLPSLPFHVAIADGGLEIEARIKATTPLHRRKIMNKPASHGDGRPLAAHVEDETSVSPNKATKPTSVPNLPLIPSDQGSLPSLPFHVAIADGGLEIEARIKKERDLDNLIQIL